MKSMQGHFRLYRKSPQSARECSNKTSVPSVLSYLIYFFPLSSRHSALLRRITPSRCFLVILPRTASRATRSLASGSRGAFAQVFRWKTPVKKALAFFTASRVDIFSKHIFQRFPTGKQRELSLRIIRYRSTNRSTLAHPCFVPVLEQLHSSSTITLFSLSDILRVTSQSSAMLQR